MFLVLTKRQWVCFFIFFTAILVFICQRLHNYRIPCSANKSLPPERKIAGIVSKLFFLRNQAILQDSLPNLASLYDRTRRLGLWAFEHQAKKMKYLHNWRRKQGAVMSNIKSVTRLRRIQWRKEGIRLTLLASTEYHYFYLNERTAVNLMRLGTYHSVDLLQRDGRWVICREWFTDPFADSLAMEKSLSAVNTAFILAQKPRHFPGLNPRRLKAALYADKYCGAAAGNEVGFIYNPKYKNYNYSGGDCANFVSQVLHEGGGFSKTRAWNYGKGASRAWANAHAFHRYMQYSGRASRIAYGAYNQVLAASYKLLPGDYVAYEKKGEVRHVSVVTGADSKGFAVTNSHNADRFRVPWDLGYGDKGVRFWFMRVHY